MTTHYLDLRLRPNPELAPHQIMSALYGRLHGLFSLGVSASEDGAKKGSDNHTIGVSFPEHDDTVPTLGKVLRLHATEAALDMTRKGSWLVGIRDYVHIGEVHPVPDACGYRTVSRVQVKSNSERLQRRAMKRHGYTEDQAKALIPLSVGKRSNLPFVTLGSKRTGQAAFRLFIRHGVVGPQRVAGEFGTYGLSGSATVPWF